MCILTAAASHTFCKETPGAQKRQKLLRLLKELSVNTKLVNTAGGIGSEREKWVDDI